MASLRVQGLIHEGLLDDTIQELKSQFNLRRWKISRQSTDLVFEATFTFPTIAERNKAQDYVTHFVSSNPTHFDGVDVDNDFHGVTVLWAQQPSVDIIAVHGLGGHAADTWSSNESCTLWLRDTLPRDLSDSRIMTFGYDASTISRSTANIRDIAIQLLNGLQTMRRSAEELERPIIFMAHSLGGIVVKWALKLSRTQGTYSNIDTFTRGIVFFGTPHHGSGSANWGKTIAGVVNVFKSTNTSYLDLLKDRSDQLAELDTDFVPLLRDAQFKIFSIYETEKTKIGKFRSILVVRKDSALLNTMNETPIPASADHRSVCKFKSQNDAAYRYLSGELSKLLPKTLPLIDSTKPRASEAGHTLEDHSSLKVYARQVLTYPKNVPHDRYFYGRESILSAMKEYLHIGEEKRSEPKTMALYGEPAVGKTCLVKRFIQTSKNEYDYILLITAESTTKLSQEFVGIGRMLELTKTMEDDPIVIRDQVLDYFNTTDKKILLIYDNADKLDELRCLRDYWAYHSTCSILVTSRDASVVRRLPTGTEGLQIRTMTEDEGEQFLIDRVGAAADSDARSLSRSIAVRFNCWPLALSQVSAWILDTRSTLRKFWDILVNKPETEKRIYAYKNKENHYEYTLSQVWDTILPSLESSSAKLLSVMSIMDPDSVPDRLFRGWKSASASLSESQSLDEFDYLSDRTQLLNYSIVEVSEDVSALHRIVQSTRLNNISKQERDEAFTTSLYLLAASFPKQVLGNHMYGQWPDCELFLPHVLSFDKALERYGWDMDASKALTYVNMMCDMTWYLWEIGQYDEALSRLDHAENVCTATIGLFDLAAARLFVVRGSVFATQNRYAEAGELFRKGLEIRKAHLAADDQLLANSYMQVGNALLNADLFNEAIVIQEKVIAIRQKSYHLTPAMMVISYLNLSRSLLGARQFEKAQHALDNAARCSRDLEFESERATYEAHRLYVVGNVLLAKGETQEALAVHKTALTMKIDTKASPFSTSASHHKIGTIYAELRDYTNATTNLRNALDVLETVPGNSKPKLSRLARSEMRLSEVSYLNGETEEGAAMRRHAIEHLASTGMERLEGLDVDRLVPCIDR